MKYLTPTRLCVQIISQLKGTILFRNSKNISVQTKDCHISAKPAYLNLPVNFLYKFDFSSKTSLYLSLGIYLGYGLGGKTKIEVPKIEEAGIKINPFTVEEDFFSKKTGFYRFDAGVSAGINLDIDHSSFSTSGKMGFINAHKETEIKNIHGIVFLAGYEVSLGYFF